MPSKLDTLIYFLSKLPGVGNKTAKRYAIHMLQHRENLMLPLSEAIEETSRFTYECVECGNYDEEEVCYICKDQNRDSSLLCVVETIADLWSMEASKVFNGKYHVLGGTLSAVSGRDPVKLNVPKVLSKIKTHNIREVIIATSTTIDGQTTAYYITEQLKPLNVPVTRIASGIPIGGELNYLDEGTIAAAFNSRKTFL